MLVEVKGDVCEVCVVVQQDLLQKRIADDLLPPALIHQVNDDLRYATSEVRGTEIIKNGKINLLLYHVCLKRTTDEKHKH